MRAVVQRVKEGKVTVKGNICGAIGRGLLVFLGIHKEDQEKQISWLVNKIINLRIFADELGKMNLNVRDVSGEILVVSQFTLYGNVTNGRRPDFIDSAPPEKAIPLYEQFIKEVAKELGSVQTGQFGAYMDVALVNEGPVTFIVEAPFFVDK
jgi:D-tyrosyl-tRNA(Tyr) deacylase